jgi:hypothetical protein
MVLGLILYTIGMLCFVLYLVLWLYKEWESVMIKDTVLKIIVIGAILSLLWPITIITILARRLLL